MSKSQNYSYCCCNYDSLLAEMAVQFFQPYCYSNVEVYVNLWYHWVYSMVDKYFPKRTKKRQKYPPWVSNKASHVLNKLSTARRNQRKKSSEISSKVIHLEANCMELQERDRKDYETNLFAEKNGQRIFKYVKSLQKENFPSRIVYHEKKEVATARRNQRKKSENSSKVIHLEAICMELQERDRKDYETNLFAEKNGQRIFKYLKSLQKERFPSRIVYHEKKRSCNC